MDSTVSKQNGWTSTKAGQQLQARLNEERTVQAIDRLLDRIETLERGVEKLTVAMERAPGMISMMTDIADESVRGAAHRGVDVEQRLSNALAIAEKLTAPAMVEKLDGLLKIADQMPGLVSMTTDMADEAYRNAAQRGIDIEQRLGTALVLAEKLTDPQMVEKLEGLLTLAEQAPGLIAMTVDVVDEQMAKAAKSNIDLSAMAELGRMMSASLIQANKMPPAKASGLFAFYRAINDPDRQKALGFLMNFAKAYGQQMK